MSIQGDILVAAANRVVRVRLGGPDAQPAIETLHEGSGFHYGITYDRRNVYVLCRNYWNQHASRHSLLVFDRSLRLCDERFFPSDVVSEGHQMMLWKDKLYLCNTNRNCLSIADPASLALENFYPPPQNRDRNYNHMNSVYVDGERLILGFANRFRDGFTLHYDFATRTLLNVDAIGLAMHDVIPYRDGYVVCSSYTGSLMYCGLGFDEQGVERPLFRVLLMPDEERISIERITINRIPHRHSHSGYAYPRGLALWEETAFIGLSEFGKRSSRRDSQCRLMIISDLQEAVAGRPTPIRTLDLGATGAVCEVRLLDRPDLGHPVPPED